MTMQASSARRGRVSWKQFIELPDDDRRELLDGRLVEMDVPTGLHEWIVVTLTSYLRAWAMARKAGVVFGSGYKVRIRSDRAFMPDVQFFRRGGRPLPDKGLGAGAPDLAVEVISPGSARYDRVLKLQGYAEIGVPEYWLINPRRRTFERFRLAASNRYGCPERLDPDDSFAPDTFPGLCIPLSELWQLPDWFK